MQRGKRNSKSMPSAIELSAEIIEKGSDAELHYHRLWCPNWSFHEVAARQFESAVEADQWLYCAPLQDIEKPIGIFRQRPLHCACQGGNIFGVKWLVLHGANVNAKDNRGLTPYSYACGSSFDRMQKMIFLEEHGIFLLPSDIVEAASSQFSSSEKADEVFHHLVNEKGMSTNAMNRNGETPLHQACQRGSLFGVKWLVEHNAEINSVEEFGKTPLMLACRSSTDRLLKIRYLDQNGGNFQAKDLWGENTALFYAAEPSKCEDDEVKVVLQYLVIEKGLDINYANMWGMTPLLYACDSPLCSPSVVAFQQLIDLEADLSVTDNKKRNALHIAAHNSKAVTSIIDVLIEKGVDVTSQDQYGNTPHQVASNGEIRALLRQHYDAARFSVLQREMVRPDSIKLCVIGDERAGKTTYVISLLQLNQPPPKDEDRTPGVEIHNCEIEGVGKGSTWDFGAQPAFHSAHGLFFQKSNTMFLLILPIREGEQMTSESVLRLLERGRFWCAFSKAALRTLPPHSVSRIRLLVIFNLIGFNEKMAIDVSIKTDEVVRILQNEFEDTFKISRVIKMDCSKSQSEEMNGCREILKQIREEMLEEADDVPKLCYGIEKHLSFPDEKRKSPLAYFLTADEFEKWVAEEVGITLSEDEKKVAFEYLDSSGIIINLGRRRICVRPAWLCHNVIGPLLAPPNFLFVMPRENPDRASKKEIESTLRAFENYLRHKGTPSPFAVSADEAIDVLRYLELCYPLEGKPGVYRIPALLNDLIPDGMWVEDSTLDMYRGQRYECDKSVDIISPSSFVILQCRCSHLKETGHDVWKDGIKLVRIFGNKIIECLIQLGIKKGRHCIDVILRWSSKVECKAEAKKFFNELKSMIAQACDERSPGVILNWFYLDSSHLQQLNEDPAIYSSSEVDQKVDEKALDDLLFSTRPERHHRASVRDLVIISDFTSDSFPTDDAPVSDHLIRACALFNGSLWENLGACLISSDDLQYIHEHFGHNIARMIEVLTLWNRKKSPTVGQLLGWFGEFEVSRRAIKSKYESLCELNL